MNSSQLSSRLMKFFGAEKSGFAGGSLGGGIGTTLAGGAGLEEVARFGMAEKGADGGPAAEDKKT